MRSFRLPRGIDISTYCGRALRCVAHSYSARVVFYGLAALLDGRQANGDRGRHTHTHTGEGYLARLSRCVGCCVCVCVLSGAGFFGAWVCYDRRCVRSSARAAGRTSDRDGRCGSASVGLRGTEPEAAAQATNYYNTFLHSYHRVTTTCKPRPHHHLAAFSARCTPLSIAAPAGRWAG
jgi:hypothetical protein